LKAIVYTEYGPPEVLKLTEVPKPKPKDKEILIRVHATSVTSGDWHLRKADPFIVRLFFGLFKPRRKILGGVAAGVVEAVGKDVNRFNTGDRVFGSTSMEMGSYAEYVCLSEDGVLALMPDDLSFEEAAAIPFGGNTALHFLKSAKLEKGRSVLLYGASGAVGTAAVQLAKHFGAEVTAVCSTRNIELVRSLGADKVIDYTKEDFSKSKHRYDVVYEAVGKRSLKDCLKVLKPGGILLMGSAGLKDTILGALTSLIGSKKVVLGIMSETAEDMEFMKELAEAGIFKPVIDRTYSLDEIVEAHHYVEKGHKSGNVVVRV